MQFELKQNLCGLVRRQKEMPTLTAMPFAITPQEKNSNPEHLLPTLSGRPICIIKIQCDENFLAVPFCIIKTQCDAKLVLSYSYDGPSLSFGAGYHMPHSKSKGLEQLLLQNIKHQTNMLHSDNRTTASLLQRRKDKNNSSNNNNNNNILHSHNGTEGTASFGSQSENSGFNS